ncbi:MAG: DUF1292 domain-containing protein [Clostridia bacterium]|nr:DUF1292 domain-containing protein [Clostridia bacterium]
MDEERDLIVLTDEDNNEMTMEILDYFYYEGNQYALMVEFTGDEDDDDGTDQEAYIMRVNPVGEDEEEFVAVDEDLMPDLIDFVENELFADEEDEDMFGDAEDPEE